MDDILINAGKYASAISAVIALVALVAWKPIATRRKAKREKAEAERRTQQDFQDKVLAGIESISQDVGDLQCDRLTQAHDFYVTQGYCPSTTKQVLVAMHQSYRAKGRNHLCNHYEEDILSLPGQDPCRVEAS